MNNEQNNPQSADSVPPRESPEPKPLTAAPAHSSPPHQPSADGRMSQPVSEGTANELPAFVHQYLRDFITFADQKAAFTFAVSAALIAFLEGKGVTNSFGRPFSSWQIDEWIGATAIILLVISALLAAGVVVPRLKGRSATGAIYWEEIRTHTSHYGYVKLVESMSLAAARVEVLRHCYVLAGICGAKYKMLDWSLRIGFAGVIATATLLIAK